MSFRPSDWQLGNRKFTIDLVRCTDRFIGTYGKNNEYWERRKCPVCGSENASVEIVTSYLRYCRCEECRMLYENPVLKEKVFNEDKYGFNNIFKTYWELVIKETNNFYNSKPNLQTTPILKDILQYKRSGSLLDVGCSVGTFLFHASYYFDVEGLEINHLTRAVAEKKEFKIYSETLLKLAEFREGYYDVVTFNQLLYCLRSPMEEIKAAYRCLKRDGILYINTPNADSKAMECYKGAHGHVVGPQNMNVFSEGAIRYVAEKNGFKIVMIEKEYLDIYLTDLLVYYLLPSRFVHRDNCFIPFYRDMCRIEDKIHKHFLPSTFSQKGDYLKVILRK